MLKRVGPRQGAVISLDDLKARLRIDTSDHDAQLTSQLAAATAAAERATGRFLLPGAFEFSSDGFGCLVVPVSPLRGDLAVTYIDPANVEQTVDPTLFYSTETPSGFCVAFVDLFTWPATSSRPGAVKVSFQAGADSVDPPSDPLLAPQEPDDQQMIVMLVAHWHAQVETVGAADLQSVPYGFEWLAAQRRIYR